MVWHTNTPVQNPQTVASSLRSYTKKLIRPYCNRCYLRQAFLGFISVLFILQFYTISSTSDPQHGGDAVAHIFWNYWTSKSGRRALAICPKIPPNLTGVLTVFLGNVSLGELKNVLVPQGGEARWKPRWCISRQRTAVIVAFRDRAQHLSIFLKHMHPIFRRQLLDYTIFVVEQQGNSTFNKGRLLNAGFLEARKFLQYDCFIFHDVDLLPENDKIRYQCGKGPRHLSVAVDKFNYTLPYKNLVGGASAFTEDQYRRVNGYSNSYWGWGGEDDDLAKRLRLTKQNLHRPSAQLARFKMLKHARDEKNPKNRFAPYLLKRTAVFFKSDGLSNVNYQVVLSNDTGLYRWLLVDVGTEPGEMPAIIR